MRNAVVSNDFHKKIIFSFVVEKIGKLNVNKFPPLETNYNPSNNSAIGGARARRERSVKGK